jgi:hypothetical protein
VDFFSFSVAFRSVHLCAWLTCFWVNPVWSPNLVTEFRVTEFRVTEFRPALDQVPGTCEGDFCPLSRG